MELITLTNKKLGGHIAQVNMPYVISCREDAPCKSLCYCRKGHIATPTATKSHNSKYQYYLDHPKEFFNQLDVELKLITYKYFRWHASGDIVDEGYLAGMFKIARKHPETRFLCFTKKYELVNSFLYKHKKPSNLVLCLSNWGEWRSENPHNLPTSWVDFGNTQGIPVFAYECSGGCASCPGTHCWYMKKGDSVVFKKH